MCPCSICIPDRGSHARDAPSQVAPVLSHRNRKRKRDPLGDGMVGGHLEVPRQQVWAADSSAITSTLLPLAALLIPAVRGYESEQSLQ